MPSAARGVCTFVACGAELRLEIGPLCAAQMACVVSAGAGIEQNDVCRGSEEQSEIIGREDRCLRHGLDRIAWQNARR